MNKFKHFSCRIGLMAAVAASVAFNPLLNKSAFTDDTVPGNGNAPKILIVNLGEVFTNSKAGKSLIAQIEKQKNNLDQDLKDENNKIKSEAEDLNTRRPKMSDADYNKALEALSQKRDDDFKKLRDRGDKLNNGSMVAQEKISSVLLSQVLPNIAREKGSDLIISRAAVLYIKDQSQFSVEVSGEVTAKLDKVLPDVVLTLTDQGPSDQKPKKS